MSTAPIAGSGSPPSPRPRPVLLIGVVAAIAIAVLGVAGYFLWSRSRLPEPGSPRYEEFVEAFEVGVAGMDIGVGDVAEPNLNRAIELIPQEPAAWADRGLFYLRSRLLPQASSDLHQAEQLAPDNPTIQMLIGLLDEQEGRYAAASDRFRRAAEKDADNVEILFAQARMIDKEQKAGADAEYQKLMERILAVRPNNLYVLATRLRVAIRRDDRPAIQDTFARFEKLEPNWSPLVQSEFKKAKQTLEMGGDLAFLQIFANVLQSEPGYSTDSSEVNPVDSQLGHPLRTFLKLVPVKNRPAAPDTDLTFTFEQIPDAPSDSRWDVAAPVWLTIHGSPAIVVANAREVRRIGHGVSLPSLALAPDGLIPFDWNNDFRTDLLLAGPGGLRFYQQGVDGNFTDVTAKMGLAAEILTRDYAAALAVEFDLDGDLDIVLGRRTGQPLLLRNNSDGTFTAQPIFAGVEGARAFAWADFDNDGAPDAAMLDAGGKLHVFANERSGRFIPWPAALPSERFLALAIGDADDDGTFDLLTLRDDGAILRIGDRNKRGAWKVGELGRWESLPAGAELGTIRLIAADLDSNGSTDVLASGFSGTAAWLGSAGGHYESLATPIPPNVFAVANLGCGHLDLLSLEIDPDKDQTDAQKKNHPIRHHVTGKRGYHGQTIRFRAERQQNIEAGDNRINSFGIGGEIEVRSGTHIVKQPITTPSVHIGLGERTRADLVRIQWPNGQFQVEFRVPADHTVSPLQRLKGSCPFLFTWNGEKFAFVTDTLWSSPLGLYINAQYRGGIAQTTEWVKVRGNQLVPRDGFYEARVQANLWESHFFDHLALQVIDHPPDTELFSDERFALEPMQPSFHMTELPRPVAKATDHFGNDATEAVRNVDGVYLDRSGRGRYQGITKEHWVEVDLGDDAPKTGPLWLMAQGWVHPTDSSVNFAIEQGKHDRPHGLILEVPDGHGGWKIVRDKIGFPAGKNKTAPIRLDGLEGPGVSRRFRLRTNMEIYWDALRIARGRDEAEIARTILLPVAADLQYRGILEMTQANPSSPELPDYDRIASRGQAWRDLIGFHTRFGDVRELLEKVDDRYVIMNAGDEIALKFAVPPGPRPGWKRDFIWVSDGWEKDGDFNTRFGKTVLPLPYHGMKSYDVPPGRLADDPVFRRFPRDWEKYHTRYVTPFGFERGLRPR